MFTPPKTKNKALQAAYHKGYSAAKLGLPAGHMPMGYQGKLADEWLRGHGDGRREAADKTKDTPKDNRSASL